ncbi:MAG: hypothetical protein OXN15_07795, partial [Chloroflexota bacterium]|nr:hypothetical protein [Chloroflexota bacterium]
MSQFWKFSSILAVLALLVVMGLSNQGSVQAQAPTAWVQSCDPYPERTAFADPANPTSDELGEAAGTSCPVTGGDNEHPLTFVGTETLTVYNPRFARNATGNSQEFTGSGTLTFVPRTSNLRANEVPAFSGDRIQITSDSASLGATFNVVLVDNAAPSLVITSPSTPLVVRGGVSVTFSAEFTDTGAGFVGRTTPTADAGGIEDLTLGQAADDTPATVSGNISAANLEVREGGLRLVVAGQVISLSASHFTKIDNGWRVTRELPSSNIQNIGANVPWYFEVADRANNVARTTDSIKGRVSSATGVNQITIDRFKGALNTQTFTGSQVRVTLTREIGEEDVTVTSRPRNVTTFTGTDTPTSPTTTGTFVLQFSNNDSSSIFPDADTATDGYQCPLDDENADTTTDCSFATGDKVEYEIVASSLITVDSQRPVLGQVTTGKGWNSTTGKEAPNRAN